MTGTVQRAFELASGGKHRTLDEIRRTLTSEGYEGVYGHLSGASITGQLKARIDAARKVE